MLEQVLVFVAEAQAGGPVKVYGKYLLAVCRSVPSTLSPTWLLTVPR